MARALLVVNPGASRTHGGVVRQIERVFNTAGWQVETVATEGSGDARRLAEYGVQQHVDVVAVLGGDGTVMQVAAGLVGTDVPMGVLRGGTGNQLAGNLRLSFSAVRAAAQLIRGTARPFDLGRLDRPDGAHYFAVGGGAGLDARVMAATRSSQKRRWGQLAYVATTLRLLAQVECVPFHVEVDGVGQDFEAAMILVANCGEIIPPLFKLGQGITPYDGVLDVIILSVNSVGGGVRALWHVVREAKGVYGETVFAARLRGGAIRVTTPAGSEPVQLDGEPTGDTPFAATVVPGAIQLIHPEG
ncbi:MAG: diacylglycerol/lipid kinase family protein [Gemmatimonadales bacterium]